MSFNSYFNLKNDWMPYLLLKCNSDGYMREYRIKQRIFISCGITKHFLKNTLYARLSVNNILGTKERKLALTQTINLKKNVSETIEI